MYVFNNLCCTCACLSTKALCCTCLSVLQEFCAAPGHVYLQESSVCYTLRSIVEIFFVGFGFFRNKFVCFGCFDTCSKHRNKPKKKFFGFTKQTEKQPKQILFRFFSVQTENIFCLFRGHPRHASRCSQVVCGPLGDGTVGPQGESGNALRQRMLRAILCRMWSIGFPWV